MAAADGAAGRGYPLNTMYLDGEPLSFSNYQQTDIITRENAQWYLDQDLPW